MSETSTGNVVIDPDNYIQVGSYIVIQKHNYKKIHKLNKPDSTVTLGRDTVNLDGIVGYPYFSMFKMVPKGKKGREFSVEWTNEAVELKDEIEIKASGEDNRDIFDDGKSQKLTADEIRELATDTNSASDIVETLISNSNTFHTKTEYAQEKYLKKKEKKYTEYIQILSPNLRLIADIMYKLEPGKVQHLRLDTLSQILTFSNVQSEGVHLLYDSGSNGLLAAGLLSRIGEKTDGKLVHMHPGNMSQKQALLAMNFPEEQLNRCLSVNIYSVLRQVYQGCDTHDKKVTNNFNETSTEMDTDTESLKRKADQNNIEHKIKIAKTERSQDVSNSDTQSPIQDSVTTTDADQEMSLVDQKSVEAYDPSENSSQDNENNDKEHSEPKKPKWHYDNIIAAELVSNKVDSLVIACKEDPLNIFEELLKFVKPSRPFVVYYPVSEPLQNMYIALKSNPRVCALKVTCNWMRSYQVCNIDLNIFMAVH